LSVECLVLCQSVQTHRGRVLQMFVARQRHSDRTHRGIPPENGGVPAFAGLRGPRCR
jgi:hypothetical protein